MLQGFGPESNGVNAVSLAAILCAGGNSHRISCGLRFNEDRESMG